MRRNHPKHPRRRAPITDCYDMDYVSLPELPYIARITVHPMKTIYCNIDAAAGAYETIEERGTNSRIARLIAERI